MVGHTHLLNQFPSQVEGVPFKREQTKSYSALSRCSTGTEQLGPMGNQCVPMGKACNGTEPEQVSAWIHQSTEWTEYSMPGLVGPELTVGAYR